MIQINNLSFNYKKNHALFADLSISLEKGKVCGLLGKNGAGKTTLLKIIAGLVFPDKGSCEVFGQVPKDRKPQFLSDIYFLPEQSNLPKISAQEYVACYSSFYPKFDHVLFQQCLKGFDLNQPSLLTALSHGEKKKFLLSFAFATNTSLLILDEPTNGLDIPSKAQFRKLLAGVISDEKLVILSTHQVHDVENMIDSILVLDEGKNILYQQISEINKHFSFMTSQQEPTENSFYYEKNVRGYSALLLDEERDSCIDLEILFNAILANKNNIKQILEGK